MRRRRCPIPARKRISPELVQEWIEAYVYDEMTIAQISRTYGYTRQVVKSRMEEAWPGVTGPGLPEGPPSFGDHDPDGNLRATAEGPPDVLTRPNGHRRDPYTPLPEPNQD